MRTRFPFDANKMRPLIMALIVIPVRYVGTELQHHAVAFAEHAGMRHRHTGKERKPRHHARQDGCKPMHKGVQLGSPSLIRERRRFSDDDVAQAVTHPYQWW